MNFMIIFNFITNLLVLLYLLYVLVLWRISFTWSKTLWTRKISGFVIWWKPFNRDYEKGIFSVRFMSKKKEEKIEKEYEDNYVRGRRITE